MKIYKVEIPGGRVLEIEGPEGATDDQLIAVAKEHLQGVRANAAEQVASDPITRGAKGFAAELPFMQQLVAGYGSAMPNLARGIGQRLGLVGQKSVDEARRLDAPLMSTGGGILGNILGSAAAFAPTAAIPGANTYTGAALIGAGLGAAAPTTTGESVLTNVALGGAAGLGGQALGRAVGRLIRPVASKLDDATSALAQGAKREGIPLTAGQATGSRPLQYTESVFENLPLTSGPQLAGREAQQRAFTQAVLRRAGMTGGSVDAGSMIAQKSALGGTLGDIAKRGSVNFNAGVVSDLADIVDDAAKHLPPDAVTKITNTVDKILSQVDDAGRMSGTNYQGWREPLRALAKKGDETSRYFSKIRSALDSAFKSQLAGDDAQLFAETSRKYANLKTIIDAMGGPGNAPATGQIAPAQLTAAVGRSVGREGRALGRSDLGELGRVGQVFVRDSLPNSGTAQRQLIQGLLTTGGGAGLGSGAALATGNDPLTGAIYGAGIGAGSLITPRVVQSVVNSPAGQAYLTKGLLALTEAERAALANAIRMGALGSIPALTSQ